MDIIHLCKEDRELVMGTVAFRDVAAEVTRLYCKQEGYRVKPALKPARLNASQRSYVKTVLRVSYLAREIARTWAMRHKAVIA